MTFIAFFQKVIKLIFSTIPDKKDVIYKTQIKIAYICQKWKYKLFLKPTHVNIYIARRTFSAHSAIFFLEIIYAIKYKIVTCQNKF